MNAVAIVSFVTGFSGALSAVAAAADPDATGLWKWKTTVGTKEFDQVLKLELKDGKLTGTVSRGQETVPIEDAKFGGGELTFAVTLDRSGQKLVTKYAAKISGDTLKGTITAEFNGKGRALPWEAAREKRPN
jgi:hypothetical protein